MQKETLLWETTFPNFIIGINCIDNSLVMIMKEKIVDNPLGYVNGCIKNGSKPEDWKVVIREKVLWLENSTLNTRVRGTMFAEQSN